MPTGSKHGWTDNDYAVFVEMFAKHHNFLDIWSADVGIRRKLCAQVQILLNEAVLHGKDCNWVDLSKEIVFALENYRLNILKELERFDRELLQRNASLTTRLAENPPPSPRRSPTWKRKRSLLREKASWRLGRD